MSCATANPLQKVSSDFGKMASNLGHRVGRRLGRPLGHLAGESVRADRGWGDGGWGGGGEGERGLSDSFSACVPVGLFFCLRARVPLYGQEKWGAGWDTGSALRRGGRWFVRDGRPVVLSGASDAIGGVVWAIK